MNDKGDKTSTSDEFKATLMFSNHIMATIGTIVSFILTRIHQKGQTRANRVNKTTDKGTPSVSRIAGLMIDDRIDINLTTLTSHYHRHIVNIPISK